MRDRRVLLYFAWSPPAETSAPLAVIEDRFPVIFELRKLFYPKFEQWSDRGTVDQGIAGFLDHIQKPNFQGFTEQAQALTGRPGSPRIQPSETWLDQRAYRMSLNGNRNATL